MSYANGTTVSVEKSQAEIQKLVTKYGATSFASGYTPENAVIVFEARQRRVKFVLPFPKLKDLNRRYQRKSPAEQLAAEQRRLWRAFALVIKAKLEAVASNVTTFETEFLAHIVDPSTGKTIGETAIPAIAAAYERGIKMPPLLGSGGT